MRGIWARAAAAAVAIVCGGCDWPWHHDMADQPSPAPSQGPRSPAAGAVPLAAHGPWDPNTADTIPDPLPPSGGTVAAGRALYGIYCTPCHGPAGTGEASAVATFFPRIGDLGSADVQHHGDGWLYAIITNGTDLMPAYGHELDPRERWQVVRFVRTMGR